MLIYVFCLFMYAINPKIVNTNCTLATDGHLLSVPNWIGLGRTAFTRKKTMLQPLDRQSILMLMNRIAASSLKFFWGVCFS